MSIRSVRHSLARKRCQEPFASTARQGAFAETVPDTVADTVSTRTAYTDLTRVREGQILAQRGHGMMQRACLCIAWVPKCPVGVSVSEEEGGLARRAAGDDRGPDFRNACRAEGGGAFQEGGAGGEDVVDENGALDAGDWSLDDSSNIR